MATNALAIVTIGIHCDPHDTLGGSPERDIRNFLRYLDDEVVRKQKPPRSSGRRVVHRPHVFVPRVHASKYVARIGARHVHALESKKRVLAELRAVVTEEATNAHAEGLESVFVVLLTGHGYRRIDRNGDEKDGRDEFVRISQTVGERSVLTDDELYDSIVVPFLAAAQAKTRSSRMLFLADTCHSGTMFDLKGTRVSGKTRVVSLAACKDDRLSSCDIGEYGGFGGSLTAHVLGNDRLGRMVSALVDNQPTQFYRVHEEIARILRKLNQTCVLCCE